MTPDLSTRYLGLELKSPLVASASPLTGTLDSLERLEAAGAAAVVLPSLFEEQIRHEELDFARLAEFGSESFAEALDYFPPLEQYNTGPKRYLEHVQAAKDALSIPVFASLNGSSSGGWVDYARRMQDAGADALELNVYFVPTDPGMSGADVEEVYLDLVTAVRSALSIPLAVKVGPYFSSLPAVARRLEDAGADGLVLFNRFLQPDIDLESLQLFPHLELSTSWEAGLPRQWIAILRDQLRLSLASTGGIHTVADALKMVLAGADACLLASSLLQRGPDHLRELTEGIRLWMEEKQYASVEQMKGSMSRANCPQADGYERANYMQALVSYSNEA